MTCEESRKKSSISVSGEMHSRERMAKKRNGKKERKKRRRLNRGR